MKICFIVDNIFTLGGIQRLVTVLSNELSNSYDIDILCACNENEINRELYGLSDKVNLVARKDLFHKGSVGKVYSKFIREINCRSNLFKNKRYTNFLSKSYYLKFLQRKFIKYLNEKEYDVVIGVAGNYSLLLGIIDDRLNAKTIGWQLSSFDAYFNVPNKYQWKQELLFNEYLKNLDAYIVQTDYDKRKINQAFKVNSTRIYNPISFKSTEKSNCMAKRIMFAGRLLEETKGLDLLLEAFKKVHKKHSDWELFLVGDGKDKNKIETNIKMLGLENSVFIKPFTDNIQKYYLDSSIFVLPSRWEGFGLVITEAMECGVPVIAFDNSGPMEIINNPNINGVLVPVGNVEKLTQAINSIIEDEDKRIKISEQGIKRAQDFNCEIILEEWKTLLNNLIIK